MTAQVSDANNIRQGLTKRASAARQSAKDLSNSFSDAAAMADTDTWSLWSYKDSTGEEWDAQPACFITDYVLAAQAFACGAYVLLYHQPEDSDIWWYMIYFTGLGMSAGFGAVLHHAAFKGMKAFANASSSQNFVDRTARFFGVQLSRRGIDRVIEVTWRVVLGSSILANFGLLALAASRYLSATWATGLIASAAALYIVLAIWASLSMHVFFLFLGYLPAMVFGVGLSLYAFDWQWGPSMNELLVYGLKFSSALIQALVVIPSKNHFNHNALAHVVLSFAAIAVFVHYTL